jgi:large subunit ribosomal protein L30
MSKKQEAGSKRQSKKGVAATLRITLTKSPIGYAVDQKRTVRALGLRRMHQTVEHKDTPVVRGMVAKVSHLVKVEKA